LRVLAEGAGHLCRLGLIAERPDLLFVPGQFAMNRVLESLDERLQLLDPFRELPNSPIAVDFGSLRCWRLPPSTPALLDDPVEQTAYARRSARGVLGCHGLLAGERAPYADFTSTARGPFSPASAS
jgi:hypothetical protein